MRYLLLVALGLGCSNEAARKAAAQKADDERRQKNLEQVTKNTDATIKQFSKDNPWMPPFQPKRPDSD